LLGTVVKNIIFGKTTRTIIIMFIEIMIVRLSQVVRIIFLKLKFWAKLLKICSASIFMLYRWFFIFLVLEWMNTNMTFLRFSSIYSMSTVSKVDNLLYCTFQKLDISFVQTFLKWYHDYCPLLKNWAKQDWTSFKIIILKNCNSLDL